MLSLSALLVGKGMAVDTAWAVISMGAIISMRGTMYADVESDKALQALLQILEAHAKFGAPNKF